MLLLLAQLSKCDWALMVTTLFFLSFFTLSLFLSSFPSFEVSYLIDLTINIVCHCTNIVEETAPSLKVFPGDLKLEGPDREALEWVLPGH